MAKPLRGRSGKIQLNEQGRRDEFELSVLELGADGMAEVGSWTRLGGVNYTRTWGQKTKQIETSMSGRTFRVVVGLVRYIRIIGESCFLQAISYAKIYGGDSAFGIMILLFFVIFMLHTIAIRF